MHGAQKLKKLNTLELFTILTKKNIDKIKTKCSPFSSNNKFYMTDASWAVHILSREEATSITYEKP